MTTTKKVIFLKGLPASGKSTFARELIDKNPEKYKRINKDDLRAMLDNSKWSKHNERFVLEIRDLIIKEAIRQHKDIICDDTNLDPKHEIHIRNLIKQHNFSIHDNPRCHGTLSVGEDQFRSQRCPGCIDCSTYEVEVKFFDVSLTEAIERDSKRIGREKVGPGVIRDMYNRYVAPFKKPPKLEQDPSLPHCIICDVDGTIADNNGRNPFDESKVSEDLPKKEIIELVKTLSLRIEKEEKGYTTLGSNYAVFFSGRKEKSREDTESWIRKHLYLGSDAVKIQLFMRKDDDNRKDSIVKKELFDQNIRGKMFVEFVLDDRRNVVDMWRNDLGLICLAVADGDF